MAPLPVAGEVIPSRGCYASSAEPFNAAIVYVQVLYGVSYSPTIVWKLLDMWTAAAVWPRQNAGSVGVQYSTVRGYKTAVTAADQALHTVKKEESTPRTIGQGSRSRLPPVRERLILVPKASLWPTPGPSL